MTGWVKAEARVRRFRDGMLHLEQVTKQAKNGRESQDRVFGMGAVEYK